MADEYIRKSDAVDAVPKERIVEYMDEFGAGYNYCRNEMLGSIESLEPADVVPLRHARWRHYDGMYACEACGAQLDDESPFCPMCGAKMDGKRREE